MAILNMIKVYTTDTCKYCKETKDYMNHLGLEYEEINATYPAENLDMFMNKFKDVGRGVPAFDIDGKLYVGFTEDVKIALNDVKKQ